MISLPGKLYHTGSWKEKGSWWDGLTRPCFSPEAPELQRLPPSPNRSSSWERLLYFQYLGPFLGSLTSVWFMFPNSLPFLLTPHSDEHCTPNKKHSGSMGKNRRPALEWEPQFYLPTQDLSFSIDRRELASIWGECSFNWSLSTHKTHFHLYVLPSFRMVVIWNRKNGSICYHAKRQALGVKSPWGHGAKSFHWLPLMCPQHSA